MENQADSSFRSSGFVSELFSSRVLLPLLLLAEGLALLLSLATPLDSRFWEMLGLRLLFIGWVILISFSLLGLIKTKLKLLPDQLIAFAVFCVFNGMTFSFSVLAYWLMDFSEPLWEFVLRVVGISSIISLAIIRFLYLQSQTRLRELAVSEARFDALQARIRPHFLFNSLNSVISLISVDAYKAEQTLVNMADLFRASLGQSNQRNLLKEEIQLCAQYLEIEQLRLGERLQVRWELAATPSQMKVPALLLQPLIENAVYHGIEKLEESGEIRVISFIQLDKLVIQISNPFCSDLKKTRERDGNHIALENVRSRLRHAYGTEGELTTKCDEGIFSATLFLPIPSQEGGPL